MQRTSSTLGSSPVITFLSPSIGASKRVQEVLSTAISTIQDIPLPDYSDDELNKTWESSFPGGFFSKEWNSVASSCHITGSIIHFCSMGNYHDSSNNGGALNKSGNRGSPFSLLGVTNRPQWTEMGAQDSIQTVRNLLSYHTQKRVNILKIKSSTGMMSISSSTDLLRSLSMSGLPMLSLPKYNEEYENNNHDEYDNKIPNPETMQYQEFGLKEIVIPHFEEAAYTDGSTLLSKISEAKLTRPIVGVYRWTNPHFPINFRPLPTAIEDKVLPSASLIFHCTDTDIERMEKQSGIRTARIGYGGRGAGQLMLIHEDLAGLDIRYCPKLEPSSSFCEAQDSLMAGSLGELQSTNTLRSGVAEEGVDDEKLGNADCWIETRATLKRPGGYFRRSGSRNPTKTRIAKIPDIPYE